MFNDNKKKKVRHWPSQWLNFKGKKYEKGWKQSSLQLLCCGMWSRVNG